MYLRHLKTMLVEAIKTTFDDQYPNPKFRGVHCSIEYPVEPMNYPGIWVDYEDVDKLKIAGVDHVEHTDPAPDGTMVPFTRWRFSGYASFTLTALTSSERDELYDELVRVLAFGKQDPMTARFRQFIEDNAFIAANFDFDEIEPRGNAAAPGTPWGTDEIIYERTVNMEVLGEFITDNLTGALEPLNSIKVTSLKALGPDDDPAAYLMPDDNLGSWH